MTATDTMVYSSQPTTSPAWTGQRVAHYPVAWHQPRPHQSPVTGFSREGREGEGRTLTPVIGILFQYQISIDIYMRRIAIKVVR